MIYPINRKISVFKNYIHFLFIIIISVVSLYAQSETTAVIQSDSVSKTYSSISGSLPLQLTLDNSPYLVEADIFVTPGTTVSIESGVVLLFSNFTGLHVQGSLYVKGTKENPVVFTSRNDPIYNQVSSVNAAPYDWNGIDIYESAIGTLFDNCIVQYSVYGIRSQTEHLKIQNSFFLQNGKSNVSVKDHIFTAGTTAFSYVAPNKETTALSAGSDKDSIPSVDLSASATTSKKSGNTGKHNSFKNILRYSGVVLAVGGVAAAAAEYNKYKKAKDDFDLINQKTDYNMQTYTSSDWEKADKKVKDETTMIGVFGGAGILGLIMFGVSFAF